jgi:hypothetical protein
MSAMIQYGVSASGLHSAKLRDLDAQAPRARLPPRALPDDVRRKLGLAPRAGVPRRESGADFSGHVPSVGKARMAPAAGARDGGARIPGETMRRLNPNSMAAPRRMSVGARAYAAPGEQHVTRGGRLSLGARNAANQPSPYAQQLQTMRVWR